MLRVRHKNLLALTRQYGILVDGIEDDSEDDEDDHHERLGSPSHMEYQPRSVLELQPPRLIDGCRPDVQEGSVHEEED